MADNRPTPAWGPPSILNRWPVLLAVSLCLLVPFFLPIPMHLRRHPLIGHLGDQVHVPFLAALTLLIYWYGPLRGRLKYSALAALALGAAIEFLQLLVGRAALLQDFLLDVAGVTLAVGLVVWLGYRSRVGMAMMLGMALLLAGQLYFLPGLILGSYQSRQTFPVLTNFEGSYDHWLWQDTYEAQLDFVDIPAGEDSTNAVLRITGGPPSRWPGAQMRHFDSNWTAYQTLKIDVRNVTKGRAKVPFTVRLDDFRSRLDQAYVSNYFRATDQWQTFSVPLVDRQVRHGERLLEIDDLSYVLIVLGAPADSTAIEIDNIRLE